MAYQKEVKEKVLRMLANDSKVKFISKVTGVKGRTIRNWRDEAAKEVSYRVERNEDGEVCKAQKVHPDQTLEGFEEFLEEVPLAEVADAPEQADVILALKSGDKLFTRAQIDEYFLYYSTKGYDFSQRQMLNHFGILAGDWGKIKNTFKLLKVANVFSDFSFDLIPPSQRIDAVEERLSVVHANANVAIDRAYTKGLQKALKKKVDTHTRNEEVQKHFFAELAASFAKSGPVIVRQPVVKDANGPKELFVAASDIHINSRVEGLKDAQDYNNEVCKRYLSTIARDANAKNAESVTVLLNGDLIESVTGKNHADVFTEMEYKSTYAEGIMKAVHILAEFLSRINNLNKVLVISGNHDRLTSSNHEDAHGGAAQIITEFLKLMLSNSKIEWDPKVLTHETSDIVFITSHGDKLQRVKTEEIFYRYGSRSKFNFYLTGHWHNRGIKADTRFGRHLSLPSIFTGNTYSDFAGYTSDPGYVMIYTENGKPVVEDRSL